ncbi:MAG: polyprenyl synthetase family protein [Gammaproteobacteria bacterium]|nr:polyprenyl synthetase family protein [Gammaproteobacteria bacterium]
MTINRLKTLVQNDLDAINNRLLQIVEMESGLANELSQHIMSAGGKRMRPLIVLLSSQACGYQGSLHIPVATLIECFHVATLLHDDVVDESTLRRGKETANSIWGSKASILVGDLLLTIVLDQLLQLGHAKVQQVLSKTVHDITQGELKQLANRHNINLSYEDYLDIIRSKTALLFALSASIGPILQGSEALEDAFYQYGLHLGNAFQLIDDTLDYCSDAQTMGKNSGDDLADGKLTLPVLHVLHHGNDLQKKLIMDSFESGSHSHFVEILSAIEATGAIEYTRAAANREKNLAIQALDPVPDSQYKTALIDLATFALERNS